MADNLTIDTHRFLEQRMTLLAISMDMLDIDLYTDSFVNTDFHKIPNGRKRYKIFEPNDKGIGILLYSIRGEVQWFRSAEGKQKTREYRQTRLLHPKKRKDNSIQKYDIPKGQKTLPFFPPLLLQYFESGKPIDTLYLTEGHFKAFKATMHGIFCVGLPSITCLRDKDGLMHEDIISLIKKCHVQRLVWLQDGDCRNITSKEITEQVDLATRPYTFYKSVESFYDLMSKEGVRLYFAQINSLELEGNPKGIDDLLCSLSESEQQEVAREFNDFRVQKAGMFNGNYLTRIEITRSTRQVYQYFMLDSVDEFYHFHLEQRTELKDVAFRFFGTTYRYDQSSSKCAIVTPKSAENYFRVGDTYYQYVEIPDQWNTLVKTFERRERKTILEDNGKEIFEHIRKYTSFCNVPSHTDYQQIIHNCYNLYHPFDWHISEDVSCSHTLAFIKHIFGNEPVLLKEDEPGSQIERWELGLDYLQLLYQKPQQVLPILCLISKERQTGKTTFGDWLKELYKENMAIVGNADLKSEFNAHWISKLIVMVDETKVDQEVVVERLKALSTAKSAIWNSKGKDHKSIPTFVKFILNSNKEDDFIRIDKHEIRFWVIRVPKLPEDRLDVKLLRKMVEEIPNFLSYLGSRQIKAPEKERHWFESRLLITEALQSVVAHSKITVEKQIEIALTELFESSGEHIITMPLSDIATLIKQQNNKSYVSEVLKRMGYKSSEYPSSKYFPRISERRESNGEIHLCCEYVKFKGRFYTFQRIDFTASPEEISVD